MLQVYQPLGPNSVLQSACIEIVCSINAAKRDVVGAALFTTTIVLASGFLILGVFDLAVNSSLGVIVALTIVIALIYDLLFLPALLIFADKWLMQDTEETDNAEASTMSPYAPGKNPLRIHPA